MTDDEKKIIDKLNFNQELNLHTRLVNDPAFSPNNIFAALEYKTKRVYLRDPMIIYLERELMHSKKDNEQLSGELQSMNELVYILNDSNTKLTNQVKELQADLALQKENLSNTMLIFEKERAVINQKHESEISNIKLQWKDDQEMYNKEIKLKDLIIESLNKSIQKMTEEIKVIKSVLKSPHLYSKLNEYATKQMSFDKLKQGVEQNKSVENKDRYKMFDKLDFDTYTSATIQSIQDK